MIDRILKTEPVRLYSIATALVALCAYVLPSGAWPLVLGLVAAVVGVGAAPGPVGVIRNSVWSQESHERVVEHVATRAGALPPPDEVPTTGAPGGEV